MYVVVKERVLLRLSFAKIQPPPIERRTDLLSRSVRLLCREETFNQGLESSIKYRVLVNYHHFLKNELL
jgi:hypothetical protein